MKKNFFSSMIQHLRTKEEVVLYQQMLGFSKQEESKVIKFLEKEYGNEALNFPHDAPGFDKTAALWAAKIIYISAQLVLFREANPEDLEPMLPDFEQPLTPSVLLSADLTLRFLPDVLRQVKLIDSEDPLLKILEPKLLKFHYSGVNYQLDLEQLDFEVIENNKCLQQLYANRIIENKKLKLAELPTFRSLIASNLSIFKKEIWSDFEVLKSETEE